MDSASLSHLQAILDDSMRSLFESLGVQLSEAEHEQRLPPDDHHYFATIGFTGKSMRGTLLLTASHGFVADTRPGSSEGPPREEELADWIGELSNQLLGRVKNRLVERGILVDLSTPAVVVGRIHRISAKAGIAEVLHRACASGSVLMLFDAQADADLVVPDASYKVEGVVAEGALELF